jgi:membrane protein
MIVQLYVTKLKGFSTYGSLTTLMLVMFWLYFCCYFVMLGAEINEMLRRDGLLAKKKKKQVEKPASK